MRMDGAIAPRMEGVVWKRKESVGVLVMPSGVSFDGWWGNRQSRESLLVPGGVDAALARRSILVKS